MKKINSEINYTDDLFKIKIGTTDKKNPDIVYIEIGSYISPIEALENYTKSIANIEKKTKSMLNSFFSKANICEKDFIFVSDIADERISSGKKSYIDMQIFIKPVMELKCKKFSNLCDILNSKCVNDILPEIKSYINENGFNCYKTRK